MKETTALIFGFNKYASEIAENVASKYKNVYVFSLNKEDEQNEEYDVHYFDLSDHWEGVNSKIKNVEDSIAFCVLDDDAQNIFLTISLRAYFNDLTIIALATNKESANKLSIAGANKVIPMVQTTADIITNMLEKPVSTKILHGILYEESELKIAPIEVQNADQFNGEYPADIDWSRYNGIVVLSIMHEDMSSEFIYSSKTKHNQIKNGDVLIVVGYEADLLEFEKKIGSRRYGNWNHWGW